MSGIKDQMHSVLESIVPSCSDWLQREIFTSNEITIIVSKIRTYEYSMQRNQCRSYDYISYITYMESLEQLRIIRTKQYNNNLKQNEIEIKKKRRREGKKNEKNEDNNNKNNKKKYVGDYYIMSHLHRLYQRLLLRYGKQDISVYERYITFCSHNNCEKRLSKVYIECLQYHPTCVNIWIAASSHEYFISNNINTARILLQRAIRMNCSHVKNLSELYIQYFV